MNEFSGILYVRATDLNRGKASSCIKNVHDNNSDTVIIKNSTPYAVIISVEKYQKLIDDHERLKQYIDLSKGNL